MNGHWTPGSFTISASAGYGKTQKLCTRLLAHFISDRDAARRTVAMTFTKPAAGEIYSRMLEILSSALRSDKKLDELRQALPPELCEVSREELHGLLIRLIRDMDKLNISTIDSFFYRLVRVFAVELGLPGKAEFDEAGGESPLTEALLRELFGNSGASRNLLNACREARLGDEKKTFFDSCMSLLKLVQRFRDRRERADFWGGKFAAYTPRSPEALKRALEKCDRQVWPDKYRTHLGPLLARCAGASDPKLVRFTRKERSTLRAFCQVLNNFPAQMPDDFKSGWDYTPVADELRLLLENGRDILLCQCAMRTAGLRLLLDEYQKLYERTMLRRGRITFADLPLLLAENSAATGEEHQAFLYEIQYRTNSRFLHFLIDEFQDTSRLQWRVLSSLVGDNGDGDHSLFIVGDVKQAIYGWREGDSKLMGEVAKDENLNLKSEPLELSYRYGPEICEALNTVFPRIAAAIDTLRASGEPSAEFFGELLDRWNAAFQLHDTAKKDRHGEFEVLALAPDWTCTAVPDPRPEEPFADVAARMIVERLERVNFFSASAGVTAAVLVRSNGDGIGLRKALLKQLPAKYADRIVWEGNENIVNNPLAIGAISFGIALQHPAETFARETAAMNLLLRDLLPATEEERLEWLTLVDEYGIAGFLRRLLFKMDERARGMKDGGPLAGWSPAESDDADALLSFAESVDRLGGSRDFIRFRDLAAAKRKKAAAIPGKLQIMTIHHSKGLSFDLVFHPVFDPAKPGSANWKNPAADSAVTGGQDPADPEWMLNGPREEGMSKPEIATAVRARHADVCFEELCALYVALTRAKRGVYVFLPQRGKGKSAKFHCDWKEWPKNRDTGEYRPPGKTSPRKLPYITAIPSCYISDLLFEALFADPAPFPDVPGAVAAKTEIHSGVPCLRRVFGTTWFPNPDENPDRAERRLAVAFRPAGEKLHRAAPSKLDGDRKLRFALPQTEKGELLGISIHKFFESVGRWSEFTPPPDADAELRAHYDACAANPELTGLLDEECELWRERPFDVVIRDLNGDPVLVSGCFDRVQIRRDERGAVTRACIIDYKSDQIGKTEIAELVEHYRVQLETYRTALASLLGVAPDLIDCRIVFTRVGVLAAV